MGSVAVVVVVAQHRALFRADRNVYLAEIIFLLSTTQADEGYERVDYSLLSPEQVATLCEGPSEQQLRAALTNLVNTVDESEKSGKSHE